MKFSIIIPVYNCGKTLAISVDSILAQTYPDWELILVNDGSKDNSLEICRDFEKKDARITVFDQKNSGPSTARNTGLLKAKGDYVFFCDADDSIEASALEALAKETKKYPWEVIAFGYYDAIIQNELIKIGYHQYKRAEILSNDILKTIYPALDECAFTHPVWNKVFLRSFLIQNHICFPDGIIVSEDFIFNQQVFGAVNNLLIIDSQLYYYIHHSKSLTTKFQIEKLESIEYVYSESLKFFSKWLSNNQNRVKNTYLLDLSVFINNMYNSGTKLSFWRTREIIKNILSRSSVKECISSVKCIGFRNKIFRLLLKMKNIFLIQLTGKISRLIR